MDLHRLVRELFPPFVAVAVARCADDRPSPYPEEAHVVARAVDKRRQEFLSGRACAHRALQAVGLDQGPVLPGARREPVWPPGAVGSIAHAGDWSVAVAARAADARGLGVDLEELEPPLEEPVDRLVRSPAERAQRPPNGHPLARHAGKLVFSIKEAVYKCLFPLTGSAFEFADVTVSVDYDRGTYAAHIEGSPFPPPRGRETWAGEGRFRAAGGYVVSGLWVP